MGHMTDDIALVCREIAKGGALTQRALAARVGVSLGKAHYLLREAEALGYVRDGRLRKKGREYMEPYRVDNAIILAAGFGSRFVPFTYDVPKGLLKVHGEPMIERQIRQLHEAGVTQVVIVVGYLKEKFDYLIDKFGVKLIYNPEYETRNNLSSLLCALDYLGHSYICYADHWLSENIFNAYETRSWYTGLPVEECTDEWYVTEGPGRRIVKVDVGREGGIVMVGPAFLSREFSELYKPLARAAAARPGTEDWYWEEVVLAHLKELPLYVNEQPKSNVHEFDDLDALRQFDASYDEETDNEVMRQIARTFGIRQRKITQIKPIKTGLTNRSFVFSVAGKGADGAPCEETYVFRMGGAGTDSYIDRAHEKAVYERLAPFDFTDEVVTFDVKANMRITKYYADTGQLDPFDDAALAESMRILKRLHDMALPDDVLYDVVGQTVDYHDKAKAMNSLRFTDIEEMWARAMALCELVRRLEASAPLVLCHGDFQYTNILVLPDGSKRVIDWEYSGASRPLCDVALYGVFAFFDRARFDVMLPLYLGRAPTPEEWAEYYLYVAIGGLDSCMWAEYKQGLGQEMGEYPMNTYRHFKDFERALREEGHLDVLEKMLGDG